MFLDFVNSMIGTVPVQLGFIPVFTACFLLIVFSAVALNFFMGFFLQLFYRS